MLDNRIQHQSNSLKSNVRFDTQLGFSFPLLKGQNSSLAALSFLTTKICWRVELKLAHLNLQIHVTLPSLTMLKAI